VLKAASGTSPSQELDKDAFLQLLVTQLSYQNPLEPLENTEFIAQLAQFSSLEQMQNIATGMNLLTLSQTAATNSSMVNLIGKRVIIEGNELAMDGEKGAEIKFNLQDNEQYGTLLIKDERGSVVRRIQLQDLMVGDNSYYFDGKNENGAALERGLYTYEIQDGMGGEFENLKTYSNLLVDSVFFEGSSIYLKSLDQLVNLGDVQQVMLNY
jgi:flagellar basal-body rod modification protein FlgD